MTLTPSTTDRTSNWTSGRLLAAVGLGYPVLTLLGFAAFPEPPGGDVSAAHDPAWLALHTGSVIAQSYVRALAAVAFLVLSVAVARVVAPRSGTAARMVGLGGAGCALLLLAGQASVLGAALAARDGVEPSGVRVYDGLNAALLGVSSLPAVVLFAAAGAVFLGSGAVPRWLAVLTAVGVPLALVDAFSYDGGPLAFVGLIGLAYFLLWSLATGIVLLRGAGADERAASPEVDQHFAGHPVLDRAVG